MPPHLRRDLAKERRWRGIIANWQASEISITEYCRLNDIPYRDLANWRRIIRARDLEHRTAGPSTERTNKRVRRRPASSVRSREASQQPENSLQFPRRRQDSIEFAEVQLIDKQKYAEQPSNDGNVVLEVMLPSGISLRIKACCPLNFLSSVVSALENH